MREWSLGPGDPLELTISADFRLCTPDIVNDHIWELVTAGGDPPTLALRTTYGLRARSMRIFPRFTIEGQTISDPSAFFRPLRLRRFYPNFLMLDSTLFEGIDVTAEYWVPGSQVCAGRFSLANHRDSPVSFQLELCAQLVALEGGHPMAHLPMQPVNVLAGETADLAPIIFLTGGPQPGAGPYPSLEIRRSLDAGETRTLTWAQAALGDPKESLELARRTAALPWEAARANIDLTNASQTVEVVTGDPDWDAALALSQKTAFRLFFGAGKSLPYPSFVLSRQPDQGFSPRGDGSDTSPSWSGQSPQEAVYLASLLPGAPQWGEGLLRNFLSTQSPDGAINWKVGRPDPRGGWLAAPLLSSLAWQIYQHSHELNFLREVQPGLNAFMECWLAPPHDRDGDGFPEWDHLLQTGFEDNPAFSIWHAGSQGADISAAESPALGAMLCKELRSLGQIAGALGQPEEEKRLRSKADGLSALVEACWNPRKKRYQLRDRDSHFSPAGKTVGKLRGPGTFTLDRSFGKPLRLLVRLDLQGHATRRPVVTLTGQQDGSPRLETFERGDFHWGHNLAVATCRGCYTSLVEIKLDGVEKRDRLTIMVVDYASNDITLLLPLWADIPDRDRAAFLLAESLLDPAGFGKPFGSPACPDSSFTPGRAHSKEATAEIDQICNAVHLPWNALIAEGLLNYGMRPEAAQICYRLMSAVIRNLKKQHAFSATYHAATGAGMGERNSLQGLAPVGLFLETLGVRIETPERVVLSGKNPYPWPVTVKYRGLMVTRQADQTVVVFPNGQTLTLPDPTDAVVSIE